MASYSFLKSLVSFVSVILHKFRSANFFVSIIIAYKATYINASFWGILRGAVRPVRVDHLIFVTKNNGYPTFTGYPLFYCRPCPTDAIIAIFQITVMSAHAAVREFLRFQLSMCLPKKDETVCASLYSLSPGYCPSPAANSTSPSTSP